MSRLGRRAVPRLPLPDSPFTLCCDISGLKRECVSAYLLSASARSPDHVFKSLPVSSPACVKRSIPCQLGRQTFKWLAALCAQMFARDELKGSRGVSVRDVTNEVPALAAVWISMTLENHLLTKNASVAVAVIANSALQRGDTLMPGELIGHFCRDRDVVRIHMDVDVGASRGVDAPPRTLWQLFANTPEEAWEEYGLYMHAWDFPFATMLFSRTVFWIDKASRTVCFTSNLSRLFSPLSQTTQSSDSTSTIVTR